MIKHEYTSGAKIMAVYGITDLIISTCDYILDDAIDDRDECRHRVFFILGALRVLCNALQNDCDYPNFTELGETIEKLYKEYGEESPAGKQ